MCVAVLGCAPGGQQAQPCRLCGPRLFARASYSSSRPEHGRILVLYASPCVTCGLLNANAAAAAVHAAPLTQSYAAAEEEQLVRAAEAERERKAQEARAAEQARAAAAAQEALRAQLEAQQAALGALPVVVMGVAGPVAGMAVPAGAAAPGGEPSAVAAAGPGAGGGGAAAAPSAAAPAAAAAAAPDQQQRQQQPAEPPVQQEVPWSLHPPTAPPAPQPPRPAPPPQPKPAPPPRPLTEAEKQVLVCVHVCVAVLVCVCAHGGGGGDYACCGATACCLGAERLAALTSVTLNSGLAVPAPAGLPGETQHQVPAFVLLLCA